MNHKRYEISFHAREVRLFTNRNTEPERVTSFVEAETYQRNIVSLLMASLHKNKFEMVAPAADGAWSYEGYAL